MTVGVLPHVGRRMMLGRLVSFILPKKINRRSLLLRQAVRLTKAKYDRESLRAKKAQSEVIIIIIILIRTSSTAWQGPSI